jgi:asparagine synthase (glutamine-hydrolysing)
MCGLFASIGFEPDEKYIDIVAHRGPDGRGWKVFPSARGPVVLGHRRLSIIDVDERANQPMSSADGRFWLVFNGEIYNYIELREELRAAGMTFTTKSDSEVLLQGYVHWGASVLDRLIGMYAFVIWDAREQRLFAARDRFGVKPLVYHASQHGIAFGSEIKQLTTLPGFSRRVDMHRAWDFLTSGITDHTDGTMFADAKHLRPGQALLLDLHAWRPGDQLPIRTAYSLPTNSDAPIGAKAAGERFRELLDDSVRLQLRSDVRVGSCLSGGLDSSSIVSLMARQFARGGVSEPVHTVSACFPNKEVDEKPFMDAVIERSRTKAHFTYPRAEDLLQHADKITWHQDEPFGSTSIYAQWCVFEEARKQGIKVMLDGQGADEQLAGYHGGFGVHIPVLVREKRWGELARLMVERRVWHGVPLTSQLATYVAPHWPPAWRDRLMRLQPPAPPAPDYRWWDSELMRQHAPVEGSTFLAAVARDGLDPVVDIATLCRALTATTNLPMLLRFEDRNSMAHSIEARVPFLDHRLVEFNIALGNQHKIVGGDTKRVLRNGMRGIIPEKVRRRRDKLGFSTPEQAWVRGSLRGAIEDGLENAIQTFPGLFEANEVRRMAKDMLDGVRPVDTSLWRIVNFGTWGRVFQMSM